MKIESFQAKKTIYKNGLTTVIEAGDVVRVYLKQNDPILHSFPTVDLTVVTVFDNGKGFTFNRLAGATVDVYASEILGVHEQHAGPTCQVCDYTLADVSAAITSVEIAGAAITLPNFPYAITALGAAALESDLQDWFEANHPYIGHLPHVTITFDATPDPDEIDLFVGGSLFVVDSVNGGGAGLDFTASNCEAAVHGAVYPVPS